MKKAIIKAAFTTAFSLALLFSLSVPAQALSNAWDSWNPTDNGSYIQLTCPETDLATSDIFAYAQALIAGELGQLGTGYACYQLRFPCSTDKSSYFQDEFAPVVRALWPRQSTVVWAQPSYTAGSHLTIIVHINGHADRQNSSSESLSLYTALESLISNAKNASSTARGQLAYINQWLVDNVVYLDGTESYSSAGPMIYGKAVCQGYSNVIMDACQLLGIPCIFISNNTHGWNCVYVDGQWLMLDSCWNDNGKDSTRYFLIDEITGTSSHSYDKSFFATVQALCLTSKQPIPTTPATSGNSSQGTTNEPTTTNGNTATTDLHTAVNYLIANSILLGDENGDLQLSKSLTRAEMAAMLVRINGMEQEVSNNYSAYAAYCYFNDVPAWAKAYVGYCVSKGLVQGYISTTYGASDKVNYAAWCTVVLRWLGYAETDWSYNNACTKAANVGILSNSLVGNEKTSANRGEVAKITYLAMIR